MRRASAGSWILFCDHFNQSKFFDYKSFYLMTYYIHVDTKVLRDKLLKFDFQGVFNI